MSLNAKRQSGIELLKIIALFIIIIDHSYISFTQAQSSINGVVIFDAIELKTIQYYIFQYVIMFGYIGNMIFFVCSSWFLIDSKNNKKEKIFKMIINTFLISMLFLITYYICGKDINNNQLIKSMFPILHGNNWYVTCYLLFYCIYPYINIALNNINKKEHFVLCLCIFVIYFIYNFITDTDALYLNKLFVFVMIYCLIAYLKKYKKEFCDSLKRNIILLAITVFVLVVYITYNFAISPINIKWHTLNNPIFLCLAISLVNIFRKINISSKIINTISGLSLFVYIIHDNFIFRSSTRDILAGKIIELFGVGNIVIALFIFALLLFVSCILIAYLYYLITNRFVDKTSKSINNSINNEVDKLIKE